ncbi:MAG: hypothetical protein WCI12_08350 [Actinomycetes bacterium]
MVDERAARVAIRLQGRLGPAGVQVARFLTGHDPAERATMVPFGSSGDLDSGGNHHDAPWPGHLPAPSPAIVVSNPSTVELTGADGVQVEVSGRGLLSTAPVRCSLHRSQPSEKVIAWAGPWPLATRWWDRRRWRVRIQVLTASGAGLLLAAEQGQWWLLGRYD